MRPALYRDLLKIQDTLLGVIARERDHCNADEFALLSTAYKALDGMLDSLAQQRQEKDKP